MDIYEHPTHPYAWCEYTKDDIRIPIHLKKDRNELLIKSIHAGELWLTGMHLQSADGKALSDRPNIQTHSIIINVPVKLYSTAA